MALNTVHRAEDAQFVALRAASRASPIGVLDVVHHFQGAPRGDRLPRMLNTLIALGQARALEGGHFSA